MSLQRLFTALVVLTTGLASACSCATSPHRPGNDAGTGGDAHDAIDARVPGADAAVIDCHGHSSRFVGTTYAPNGMDPLPGLVVAVFSDDATFDGPPSMVQCETCAAHVPGALASIHANADGTFQIGGPALDAGGTFTVVIESGGFRRVVRHLSVGACGGDVMLSAAQSSLPGASAGDDLIPRIAVASTGTSSGDVNDKFAHVLDVIGITGYDRFGPDKTGTSSGSMDLIALFSSASTLASYQVVIAPCGSLGNFSVSPNLSATMVTNLQAWLAAGGRLYASDLAYEIIDRPFAGAMTFATGPSSHAGADPADVGQGIATSATLMANIDDAGLLAWMRLVGAIPATATQMPVSDLRDPWAAVDSVPPAELAADAHGVHHASVLVSADVTWHTAGSGHHPLTVQADYPTATGGYCGRVVFTSYHVQTGTGTTLSPQERVLEYLFFQLSSCIDAGPM